jgi:pectate lyase
MRPGLLHPVRRAVVLLLTPAILLAGWQRGWTEDALPPAEGFGQHTDGGSGGPVCWVTSLADSGEGSLRACAEAPVRQQVRFRVSGEIHLHSMIAVHSDKTIDGRGAEIRISGQGLSLTGVSNVILANLIFENGDRGPDDDAVHISDGTRNVWIDHCSLSSWGDGLIDITRGATDITVSWCRFTSHDKVMLIGASPRETGDRDIRVTLHHNLFLATEERHPRLRFGKVHAYNNVLERWGSYGMASTMSGELLSQANVFVAGWNKAAIATIAGKDPARGYTRSLDDSLQGGARVDEREPERVFDPKQYYPAPRIDPADDVLRQRVEREAGWRRLPPG